ncbi:glutaminyl-tRNA synthase (glutamine-hydrolyzing) subunit A [Candidatus Daviesbacteria bacterium RIFCSPLOWO2_01_FULL_38_10]|uniref:Glutamyl-tRNA(Gln) amidotransferase subunit A n=1 Tax=Candidatus Daviesbacteria bacterium GW2011_GWF2_38_6 TaxID=1618432 RepID=A0A0G0KIH7_9BACT|nr:MAG: Glutamyl-tRNA(Gln) amidotransferase subunit A [Candidatus Daviesbacteria bacterium GW2011_GWF2_38_6]OGE26131.1 MAG: glutaminyl-tRNA synthase (glutamine-hydrolyzing) subunit A [Candidatus Daviesbacteria bacterium RIFCSPHIGHO2_02_FULL_39_41]OGE37097.1 MAG: glutaminyl-tRNA synthase (glutamine-hydrolyzing) subunit A [Candidatus Daviesbacteria bacterium RIFCSPLOWO2_01_FULL_38_10]OGE43792.1 MAG: glutaminyl-tRNA synthase (glutamine-hydrolyzing) subunit A [Candidatus Daviesbacteria bacterium RIF
MNDLTSLTLTEVIESLKDKKFSLNELNKSYLERIRKLNPKLNAYLAVNDSCQKIPAAIKDVISTKDIITTASSKILANFVPPYDASVIKMLDTQGVGVIGKTNCDEFAMGSSGENSAYGPTKNPWNLNKVPGGSSSGSAAAVAADLCVFALGSDTGGSIRQPASLCGVVGLKPTYGRVSRYGLIAVTSSFDTIGPIIKSVDDAALVLEWISGEDKMDGNCYGKKFVRTPLRWTHNIRIGVPREYFGEGLDPKVKKVIQDAIKKLEELGAEIKEVSLPHSEYALAAYYIINTSEISSNLARFDGIRYGKSRDNFGEEVKRRIMLGTYALSSGYYDEYYVKAAKVRTLIKQDFEKAFEKCDVIVGPVSPTVAWNIGEKINDPLTMYLSDIYTISANLAGIPALSIPCGFVDRLPVGLQVLGKAWDEETILKVGFAYEQVTDWRKDKPKL